ncbi:MAG: hypothetical protein IKB72_04335 [Ruminococcus sp.]|nr:hypothetical protein [Oscillospiraceae bacterium]MBR2724644.1 hypothetical protein [Ruminococcus sp.]
MKKILSMVLVLVLTLSCMALAGVSAEETEFTPSEEPIIYFEVPEDWGSYKRIFCHIWELNNPPLASWQSKKERCTAVRGTENLYSYDVSVLSSFDETKVYGVIFSSDTGMQTYDALFSAECYGDTMYCDGTKLPHPADSIKTAIMAYWKNQDKSAYGPLMVISEFGKVVGSALPKPLTPKDLMADFLSWETAYLWQVNNVTGKPHQIIIDDISHQLSFSKTTVSRLVDNAGIHVKWEKEDSNLPVLLGDANGDEVVNIKDATAIQKHVAGYDINIDVESADSDTNLTVNVIDVTAIQKYIAGIELGTPIGELYTFGQPSTYPA